MKRKFKATFFLWIWLENCFFCNGGEGLIQCCTCYEEIKCFGFQKKVAFDEKSTHNFDNQWSCLNLHICLRVSLDSIFLIRYFFDIDMF